MAHKGRQAKAIEALGKLRLHGLVVTHLPNIRYLCGFTGSSGVLSIAAGARPRLALFTDGRYATQIKEEVVGARGVIAKTSALAEAAAWLGKSLPKGSRVGFESDHMTVAIREALGRLSPAGLALKPVAGLVERLRMIKEPAEVTQIRSAVNLASSIYDAIVGDIAPGVTEISIAAEIEYLCRRMGAEGMSFETIVASGKRSALVHGRATATPVAANGFVVMDFGVILGGYCSDMTRTVHMGRPTRKSERIYSAVLEAQLAGINSVKAGVDTSKVDYEARKVIQKHGLGGYFTHSTGHGVGIEIHEIPGLRKAPKRTRKANPGAADRLKAGMVVTIEPGVYIPGFGGVRIEDMVLVTETGCEVLTPTPKELIVL
ncbi:MAG: aminopeptidase P family protein [Acidobacteriales bacterium]|nr:aminopeptidase P family protein [Terriglobales bacterium]